MLVLAAATTFRQPVLITRSSNNYGPNQYPEKLIPLFITNALGDLPLPVYGDGLQVRDWIHVDDNCRAIDLVLRRGDEGAIYNVGGGNERANLDLTRRVLRLLGKGDDLIRFVDDSRGTTVATPSTARGSRPRLGAAHPVRRGPRGHRAVVRGERVVVGKIKSGEWKCYAAQYRELA
jgi:dTDP-glucose 4,6-dehydratase